MKLIYSTIILLILAFGYNDANAQCKSGDCDNGFGTMYYKSGNKYKGNFTNGKRNGEGTFIWSNGSKYKGSWKMGNRDGKGVYLSKSGNKYVGYYENNKMHGSGKLFGSDGEVLKEGQWVNGEYKAIKAADEDDMDNPTDDDSKWDIETPKEKSRSTASSKSSTSSLKDRTKYLNFGTNLGFSGGAVGGLPPLAISLDFPKAGSKWSYGAYLGYYGYKTAFSDYGYGLGDVGVRYTNIRVGGRAVYSFDLIEDPRFQTYAGIFAGYVIQRTGFYGDFGDYSEYYDLTIGVNYFSYNGFVGMRYIFSGNKGVFAEIDYGRGFYVGSGGGLNAGFSMRF